MTVPEPEWREAEALVIDKWPQPTDCRSLNSEVSHPSQYPRAVMLWIGEVEAAESIDDIITLAGLRKS